MERSISSISVLNKRTLLGAPGIATRNKKLLGAPGIATGNKKLLGAPGIATRNKKLLGAPGIATRNKKLLSFSFAVISSDNGAMGLRELPHGGLCRLLPSCASKFDLRSIAIMILVRVHT